MSQEDNYLYLSSNRRSSGFLDTKVHCPPPVANLVTRQRLVEKLDVGLFRKLTLVIAPAGYGKSTAVAGWVLGRKTPVAWLALDQEDNELVRFWSYFFYSFKNIHHNLEKQSKEYLLSSGPLHIQKVLNMFINEFNRYSEETAIVLDDFHIIENQSVWDSFKYLVDHLPPQLHIYLVGRSFPLFLPLSSLRAKGELQEITTADLRFNPEESEVFFKKTLDFKLSRQEISSVNQHLEGWVAGMQMVSHLVSNSTDKNRFFYRFQGDQRHITEYFSEEILSHLPESVRNFLLQTSVLPRMTGLLCDYLTSSDNGQEMLEWLEELNLFLFPLDEQRRWYRYHQLFAEVLQGILRNNDPSLFQQMHQRAGEWFYSQGLTTEAVNHALEAGDYEAAAEWIEKAAAGTIKSGELSTLVHWVYSLPKIMLYRRPLIWLYYIWSLIITGDIDEAESSCLEIKEFVEDVHRRSFINEATSLDFVKSEIDILQSCVAVYRGDPNAHEIYVSAIDNIQENSLAKKGLIAFNICSASLLQSYAGMHGKLQYADYFFSATEPQVRKMREKLKSPGSFSFGYTVLSEIRYEQNRLEAASEYINTTLKMTRNLEDLGVVVPAYILLSKIEMARGRFDAAVEIWDRLEKKIESINLWYWVMVFYAHKARIAISRGDHEEVSKWIKICGLSPQDDINFLQHYQYTTLIRALVYMKRFHEAMLLAERMGVLVDEEGGIGHQIEGAILQALCCQSLNLTSQAILYLEKALIYGLEEGYCRIFLDEGTPLLNLLKLYKIKQLQLSPDERRQDLLPYVERLEGAISAENNLAPEKKHNQCSEMINSLTRREKDVLRLVAEGHSNQDIAELLFISVFTVKSHIHSICRKLNVSSRSKAIVLVKELNILK